MNLELKITESGASLVVSAGSQFEIETVARMYKHFPMVSARVLVEEYEGMYNRDDYKGASIVLDFQPEPTPALACPPNL